MNANINKANLPNYLHPTLERVYHKILLPSFEKYVVIQQSLFTNEEHLEKILHFAGNLANKFSQYLSKNPNTSSLERWKYFTELVSEV